MIGLADAASLPTHRRTFTVWAVLCLTVFVALAAMAEEQILTRADLATQAVLRDLPRGPLERLVRGLNDLGSAYVLVPMNVVVFLLLRRLHPAAAVFIPAVTAGAAALVAPAKWLVSRPRPTLAAYGFPSGHVFAAVVFFGALLYVLWMLHDQRRWRWFGAAFCAVVIAGVGFSRMYLNAHWLTDVLGGLTGGTAWLLFGLAWVDERVRLRQLLEPATITPSRLIPRDVAPAERAGDPC